MSVVDNKVNRINPKDYDTSTVQRNLGDSADRTLAFINNAFSAIDSSNNLTTTAGLTSPTSITANNIVSAQGIKTMIGTWAYVISSYPGNSVAMGLNGVAGTSYPGLTIQAVMPYSGSIVAVSGAIFTGSSITSVFNIYKNGGNFCNSGNYTSNSSGVTINTKFTKGTYTFKSGDGIQLEYSGSAAGVTVTAIGNIWVEFAS